MSEPLFLHLRFHGFALTMRGVPAVAFVPGLTGEPHNGEPEPYAFTADGIAVNPLDLDSLRVLTEADLDELDIRRDTEVDWRRIA